MIARTTSAAVLALSLLLAAQTGCGRVKKASECKAFVEKANAGSQRIQEFEQKRRGRHSASADQTATEMEELSKIYQDNAADLGLLPITVDELKGPIADYQAAGRSAGEAAKALAGALRAKSRPEAATADATFNRAVKEQQTLAERIEAVCRE